MNTTLRGFATALILSFVVFGTTGCHWGSDASLTGGGVNTYTVGGAVSGLTGSGLQLRNSGVDYLDVSASGGFTFAISEASGVPYDVTVTRQPTNPDQICTVANGSGTIAGANIINVAVTCAAAYTVGGSVTGLTGTGLVLQDNGGDALSVPTAGMFAFSTALAGGAAYRVTVLTQPSAPAQKCSVAAGTGTVTSSNVTTVAVTCVTVGRFAYVTSQAVSSNIGANTVAAFTIDATSGVLSAVTGGPYATGMFPESAAVTPNGRFLYVADGNTAGVLAYAIDRATGALTAVGGSPYAAGNSPTSITIDPSGKFVYVTGGIGGAGTVSAFTIDATTGALSAVAGSPFAAGMSPESVAVAPGGKFAYVADGNNGGVLAYVIDPASGALSAVAGSPFAGGTLPVSVTVEPSGRFVYLANLGYPASISAYAIDPTTGALAEVAGSPFASAARIGSITVDPTGRFAYVTNYFDNMVSAYAIDSTTGALVAAAGSPFAAGVQPSSLAIDPSGQFAYVVNRGDNTVSAYAVDPATGAFEALAGGPIAVGVSPNFIVVTK